MGHRLVSVACAVLAVVAIGCGDDTSSAAELPNRADTPAMSDDAFWTLIDQTLAVAGDDQERQAHELRRRLSGLEPDRILAYEIAFERHVDAAYRWDVWGAAYVVNGGCSDDCFEYFRWWLISRGRSVYERVLADPDSLGRFVETADETQLELFSSPAPEAYEEVALAPLPPREAPGPRKPAGRPWEDADLDRLYPMLAARFGG